MRQSKFNLQPPKSPGREYMKPIYEVAGADAGATAS